MQITVQAHLNTRLHSFRHLRGVRVHHILGAIAITMLCVVSTARAEGDASASTRKPNLVVIYVDDVGFGDLSCYGATKIRTPNIDKLAQSGVRFTDAHAASAMGTPSRYALLTGEYAFRNPRATILEGDAAMVFKPDTITLAKLLQDAGYATAVVGTWNLGLGNGNLDWNEAIKPGPLDVGFNSAYALPTTNDRLPFVVLENDHVRNLHPDNPIKLDFKNKVGDLSTGESNPESLRYGADARHLGTIVNGISRMGYMAGGVTAWCEDEKMVGRLSQAGVDFISENLYNPFFLYFNLYNVHTPRAPHKRFRGKSGCGLRGDVALELDWSVGVITNAIERLGIADNTVIVFTSDNGPIVTDGYSDGALENLNGHDPSGPYRGGKYQIWEGGTRLPMIVSYPGKVAPGVSKALMSQVDIYATFAKLAGVDVPAGAAIDSKDMGPAFLGKSQQGRETLIEQAVDVLAIREGDWKYIPAGERSDWVEKKHAEAGNTLASAPLGSEAQLYNLADDPGETKNVIKDHADRAADLAKRLEKAKEAPGK